MTKTRSFDPGLSRIHVVRIYPITITTATCRLCADAPCITACPREALSGSKKNGVILVDTDKCDGCGWCVEACDYDAIVLNLKTKDAEICNLCQDQETGPQCVRFCPKEALALVKVPSQTLRRLVRAALFIACLAILGGFVALSRPLEAIRSQVQGASASYLTEGDRLAQTARQAEAILAYRHAVEQDPRNAVAQERLGRIYITQGRRRLAQLHLERALALRPGNAEITATLAQLKAQTTAPAPLWQTRLGDDMPAGVAWQGDTLYAALENGSVQALAVDTGRPRWQVKLPAGAASAPTPAEGLVLVGGADGTLYALATPDGAVRWRYVTPSPIHAAPEVAGQTVYCASSNGTLYALSLDKGELLWKYATHGPLYGRPTVDRGIVYFGSGDGVLYALDATSGAPRWPQGVLTQGPVDTQPVVVEERVLLGSSDGRLYALARESGGAFWRYSTPDGIYARPLVVTDTVYVASSGQVLAAVNLLTGKARWEWRTASALIYTPHVAEGVLYTTANSDANLYALDARSGKALWQLDTGDWLASGPLVSGTTMILAGKDGTVLAYRLPLRP
jgi:outer membrane protein assembly factor BamB/Fe-S-cluster-containing hydrogenase component 2